MAIKPIDLAVLIPCCVVERDGGIAVSSRLGPQIEMMAELVGSTTILGYDPPAVVTNLEDRTDFVMRPAGGRIRYVSLGPKGTWRDFWARRKRVREIVARESVHWDVLSTPLVNRRVGLVYNASKCRRVMAQIGGHTGEAIRSTPGKFRKKIVPLLFATMTERTYRRLAREQLFFANGEKLVPHYAKRGAVVDVVRTSARRAQFSFHADDRLSTDTPKLVTLSRLTALKAVDDALQAFALLKKSTMPNAELHVIGGGDAEGSLKQLAVDLGVADSVTFYGWIPLGPELFDLLRQMDVLITLSHEESLPNTVWECMAQSLLVVSTPVGALPYACKDGEDLLFVPEYDPAAAAAAVERLAADPALRKHLLERGRESAARASVEAVCAELLDRMADRWPELREPDAGS